MSNCFDSVVSQFSGAVISGAVGITAFWFKRRWEAKDHYRIAMSQIIGGFNKDRGPLEYYDATIRRMEDAVFRLLPFLKQPTAAYLSALWDEYIGIRNELQKDEIDRAANVFNDDWKESWGPIPKDKREIVKLFHKKFSEIAK